MEKRAQLSQFTLRHELDVLSTKAALVSAMHKAPEYRVLEFSTWPRLFSFETRQLTSDGYSRSVTMKPEAFLRTEFNDGPDEARAQSNFFLELDRSTETQKDLRGRSSEYLHYYRSGGFAERCGHVVEDFRQFPFRVLWIFRNAERHNNAAEPFLRHSPPILTMAWLTTFQEMRTLLRFGMPSEDIGFEE